MEAMVRKFVAVDDATAKIVEVEPGVPVTTSFPCGVVVPIPTLSFVASTKRIFVSTVRLCAPRFTSVVAPVYGTYPAAVAKTEDAYPNDGKVPEAYVNVGNVTETQFVVDAKVEDADTMVRYVVEAFACVRKVAVAQFVVDAKVDDAFAWVRKVEIAQAVVEDMVLEAYAKVGNVVDAYEYGT